MKKKRDDENERRKLMMMMKTSQPHSSSTNALPTSPLSSSHTLSASSSSLPPSTSSPISSSSSSSPLPAPPSFLPPGPPPSFPPPSAPSSSPSLSLSPVESPQSATISPVSRSIAPPAGGSEKGGSLTRPTPPPRPLSRKTDALSPLPPTQSDSDVSLSLSSPSSPSVTPKSSRPAPPSHPLPPPPSQPLPPPPGIVLPPAPPHISAPLLQIPPSPSRPPPSVPTSPSLPPSSSNRSKSTHLDMLKLEMGGILDLDLDPDSAPLMVDSPHVTSPNEVESHSHADSEKESYFTQMMKCVYEKDGDDGWADKIEQAMFEKRTKIAAEILTTEETYVKQLEMLVEMYQRPLVRFSQSGWTVGGKQEGGSKALQKEKERVMKVFGNAETLLPINRELLSRIRERCLSWSRVQTVGDVFNVIAPLLKFYHSYGCEYAEAAETLTSLQKVEGFVESLKLCDGMVQNSYPGCIKLENLLITPVQRIPRYNLLLSELHSKTPASHPDSPLLLNALNQIQEVSDFLDRSIQEKERSIRLLSLAKKGADGLVSASRKLRFEITLSYISDGKVNSLRLFVMNDILIHVSEAKAKNKAKLMEKKHQWPLSLVWFSRMEITSALLEQANLKKEKYVSGGTLVGPWKQYVVLFRSNDDCATFSEELKRAMSEYQEIVNNDVSINRYDGEIQKLDVLSEVRFGEYTNPKGGTYRGFWQNGRIEGRGRWNHEGNVYEGTWRDGGLTGYGSLVYLSGDKYEGGFFKGQPHGSGKLFCACGDLYFGNWVEGRREGFGEYTMVDGSIYSGGWSHNSPFGDGKLIIPKQGYKYSGGFFLGEFSGSGVAVLERDDYISSYEGEYKLGVRCGRGKQIKVYGDHPTLEAASVERGQSLEYSYEGQWQDDLQHGRGVFLLRTRKSDGRTHVVFEYEGEFVEGVPGGDGTLRHQEGWSYIGQWRHGRFHGAGVLTHQHGPLMCYDGEWYHHRMHGKGVLTYRSGSVFTGVFKGGRPVNAGTYTFSNQMCLSGKWNQDHVLEGKVTIQKPPSASNEKGEFHGNITGNKFIDTGALGWSVSPSIDLPVFPTIPLLSWGL